MLSVAARYAHNYTPDSSACPCCDCPCLVCHSNPKQSCCVSDLCLWRVKASFVHCLRDSKPSRWHIWGRVNLAATSLLRVDAGAQPQIVLYWLLSFAVPGLVKM